MAPKEGTSDQVRAQECLTSGRLQESAQWFQKAIATHPNRAELHEGLGLALLHLGHIEGAATALSRAIELAPNQVALAYSGLAQISVTSGDFETAAQHLRKANAIEPNSSNGRFFLAQAQIYERDLQSGIETLGHLRQLDQTYAGAYRLQGQALQQLGKFEEAEKALTEALKLEPAVASPYLAICSGRKMTEADRHFIDQMTELADKVRPNDQATLRFALGKAHADLAEYEEAMKEYDAANRIMRQIVFGGRPMNRGGFKSHFEYVASHFRPEIFGSNDLASQREMPIFIVGMMRSGTTLVEQIVSSHPEVEAGGELPFWPSRAVEAMSSEGISSTNLTALAKEYEDLLGQIANSKPRVTDKNPGNYANLALIHLAFPNANIIHCKRDPVDTCLSIYMTPNASPAEFSYDKANIVFAYKEYRRLIKLYRSILPKEAMFEVDYEEVVLNREKVTREIIGFLGLPWNDECLNYEKNERTVRTPSAWQVRQPVYSSSVGRWKRYEPWLGEFAELIPRT